MISLLVIFFAFLSLNLNTPRIYIIYVLLLDLLLGGLHGLKHFWLH
jgi:hypothetical protein